MSAAPAWWPTKEVEVARGASGLLATFNQQGVLGLADVHVARRLGRLGAEPDERVLLAAALAVRAVRLGSVCLELATVPDAVDQAAGEAPAGDPTARQELPWPDPAAWLEAVSVSPLVAAGPDGGEERPLRLVEGLLYLDRYWRQERLVARVVDERVLRDRPVGDAARLRTDLARLFPGPAPDRQRLGAGVAALSWLTVLAGGPGTGKTTTVARLLAVLQAQSPRRLRVALVAPTGKAAARLEEAVRESATDLSPPDREGLGQLSAFTVHRLLGWRPSSPTRFRHDRSNRLPFDVVVVDEASMVSLTLMARLMEALREDTRLVLVGDPDQLASVEAGAVLGDLVRRPPPDEAASPAGAAVLSGDLAGLAPEERRAATTSGVVRLDRVFRFEGEIEALADAVRRGDPEAALAVLAGAPHGGAVELVEADASAATMPGGGSVEPLREDVVRSAVEVLAAATAGEAEEALRGLERHRLLCAHRDGPYGVTRWGRVVEQWVAQESPGYARERPWYPGRPLLVTANDYDLRLFNGDTGVVVEDRGLLRGAFRRGSSLDLLPLGQLGQVQTVHAMTVHRSQGSQFEAVTVLLPPPESPLLTRELLYTALTRARRRVRIVGSREAVRAAVTRPVVRASGLHRRG